MLIVCSVCRYVCIADWTGKAGKLMSVFQDEICMTHLGNRHNQLGSTIDISAWPEHCLLLALIQLLIYCYQYWKNLYKRYWTISIVHGHIIFIVQATSLSEKVDSQWSVYFYPKENFKHVEILHTCRWFVKNQNWTHFPVVAHTAIICTGAC